MKFYKPEILNLFGYYLLPFIRVERLRRNERTVVIGCWRRAVAFTWEGK
jgi:hypothetical protein